MEEQLTLFGVQQASTAQKKQAPPPEPKKQGFVVLHVFVDGAARGNPGPAGAGVYITTQDHVPLVKKGYYLYHKTNNQAEYLAFILACLHIQELIKHEPETRVVFHSDSQLLVRQIQGIYKVKNEGLIPLHQIAQKFLRTILFTITHVERELNKSADKLANLGIDKRAKISQAMASTLETHGIRID